MVVYCSKGGSGLFPDTAFVLGGAEIGCTFFVSRPLFVRLKFFGLKTVLVKISERFNLKPFVDKDAS